MGQGRACATNSKNHQRPLKAWSGGRRLRGLAACARRRIQLSSWICIEHGYTEVCRQFSCHLAMSKFKPCGRSSSVPGPGKIACLRGKCIENQTTKNRRNNGPCLGILAVENNGHPTTAHVYSQLSKATCCEDLTGSALHGVAVRSAGWSDGNRAEFWMTLGRTPSSFAETLATVGSRRGAVMKPIQDFVDVFCFSGGDPLRSSYIYIFIYS